MVNEPTEAWLPLIAYEDFLSDRLHEFVSALWLEGDPLHYDTTIDGVADARACIHPSVALSSLSLTVA